LEWTPWLVRLFRFRCCAYAPWCMMLVFGARNKVCGFRTCSSSSLLKCVLRAGRSAATHFHGVTKTELHTLHGFDGAEGFRLGSTFLRYNQDRLRHTNVHHRWTSLHRNSIVKLSRNRKEGGSDIWWASLLAMATKDPEEQHMHGHRLLAGNRFNIKRRCLSSVNRKRRLFAVVLRQPSTATLESHRSVGPRKRE
jgi:hypothetical protein